MSGNRYFRIGGETYVAGPTDLLGKGTYGIVYRVHNQRDASIKKAIKTFSPDSMDENDGIPSTTLREINAMMTLDHPNVMKAQDVVFPKDGSMVDMFVVMELCKGTLKDKLSGLIQEHLGGDFRWTKPSPGMQLPAQYVKEVKIIAFQLLNALAVLHSRGIMHRDLKPVNIMWGFDDLLKLGDFGLARFVRGNQNSSDNVMPQTGEVQTMWYRAPEVLLGDERYGLKVDDWSIGCIIAEMFRFYRSSTGKMMASPLFSGKSDVETLLLIFDALGTPNPATSGKYLETLPNWSKEYPQWTPTLRQRVPLIDDVGFDLLTQLLCASPFDRQAAKFLLQHSWFNDIREECKRFVPWYRGFEEGYKRMIAVNRLPRAQPLPLSTNNNNNSNNTSNNPSSTKQATSNNNNSSNNSNPPPPNKASNTATNTEQPKATSNVRSVSGPHLRSKVTATRPTSTETSRQNKQEPSEKPAQQVKRTGRIRQAPVVNKQQKSFGDYSKLVRNKRSAKSPDDASTGVPSSQEEGEAQQTKVYRQKRTAAEADQLLLGMTLNNRLQQQRSTARVAAAARGGLVGSRRETAADGPMIGGPLKRLRGTTTNTFNNEQRLLDAFVTRAVDNTSNDTTSETTITASEEQPRNRLRTRRAVY